jgi:predicted  nucleic acid-binding Zn-ribbon protein
MWFANDYVELVSDNLYGQSWSLAIGSQFKPLPTEQQLQSDITKTSNAEAFQTFAQILTRQNQLIDVVKKSISTIEMQNKIDNTNPYTDEDRAEVSKIPYKQDTLISGQNIKTINGQSLLGRGNIVIKADVNINDIIFDTLDTNKLSYDKVYSNKFVNQLLNSLEAKINNTINSNIIYQTEINNDLYTKIDDNSDKLTALTTRVTNNENTISNHQTTIDNITNRINILEENVDEIINNSIPTIQVDIANMQKDITDINTSIDGINTSIDGINTSIDGINTSITDINASIDDIVTLVETNSTDISELKDLVENLSIESISEDTINSIYEEIFI